MLCYTDNTRLANALGGKVKYKTSKMPFVQVSSVDACVCGPVY